MNDRLERIAAGALCVGFDGHAVPPHVRELIARGVSTFILFARNVGSPAQVAALNAELAALCDAAGTVATRCVDQEGGRVCRLRDGFSPLPGARALGATGDVELARHVGAVCGRELAAVGFDVTFAPCVDVDTNPANPVIGDRSFGRDPALVGRMAAAWLDGCQSAGVACCAKHFPGHGDTSVDSHLELPRLPHDLERLRAVELPPFRAAIDAGAACVMTAHVVFDALDARPATISPRVVPELLRGELGFGGVVASDCLEMKAIAGRFALADALLGGLAAGVDLFLVSHTPALQAESIDVLARAASGEVHARLEAAHVRRAALKARYASRSAFDPKALRTPESLATCGAVTRDDSDGRDPTGERPDGTRPVRATFS